MRLPLAATKGTVSSVVRLRSSFDGGNIDFIAPVSTSSIFPDSPSRMYRPVVMEVLLATDAASRGLPTRFLDSGMEGYTSWRVYRIRGGNSTMEGDSDHFDGEDYFEFGATGGNDVLAAVVGASADLVDGMAFLCMALAAI